MNFRLPQKFICWARQLRSEGWGVYVFDNCMPFLLLNLFVVSIVTLMGPRVSSASEPLFLAAAMDENTPLFRGFGDLVLRGPELVVKWRAETNTTVNFVTKGEFTAGLTGAPTPVKGSPGVVLHPMSEVVSWRSNQQQLDFAYALRPESPRFNAVSLGIPASLNVPEGAHNLFASAFKDSWDRLRGSRPEVDQVVKEFLSIVSQWQRLSQGSESRAQLRDKPDRSQQKKLALQIAHSQFESQFGVSLDRQLILDPENTFLYQSQFSKLLQTVELTLERPTPQVLDPKDRTQLSFENLKGRVRILRAKMSKIQFEILAEGKILEEWKVAPAFGTAVLVFRGPLKEYRRASFADIPADHILAFLDPSEVNSALREISRSNPGYDELISRRIQGEFATHVSLVETKSLRLEHTLLSELALLRDFFSEAVGIARIIQASDRNSIKKGRVYYPAGTQSIWSTIPSHWISGEVSEEDLEDILFSKWMFGNFRSLSDDFSLVRFFGVARELDKPGFFERLEARAVVLRRPGLKELFMRAFDIGSSTQLTEIQNVLFTKKELKPYKEFSAVVASESSVKSSVFKRNLRATQVDGDRYFNIQDVFGRPPRFDPQNFDAAQTEGLEASFVRSFSVRDGNYFAGDIFTADPLLDREIPLSEVRPFWWTSRVTSRVQLRTENGLVPVLGPTKGRLVGLEVFDSNGKVISNSLIRAFEHREKGGWYVSLDHVFPKPESIYFKAYYQSTAVAGLPEELRKMDGTRLAEMAGLLEQVGLTQLGGYLRSRKFQTVNIHELILAIRQSSNYVMQNPVADLEKVRAFGANPFASYSPYAEAGCLKGVCRESNQLASDILRLYFKDDPIIKISARDVYPIDAFRTRFVAKELHVVTRVTKLNRATSGSSGSVGTQVDAHSEGPPIAETFYFDATGVLVVQGGLAGHLVKAKILKSDLVDWVLSWFGKSKEPPKKRVDLKKRPDLTSQKSQPLDDGKGKGVAGPSEAIRIAQQDLQQEAIDQVLFRYQTAQGAFQEDQSKHFIPLRKFIEAHDLGIYIRYSASNVLRLLSGELDVASFESAARINFSFEPEAKGSLDRMYFEQMATALEAKSSLVVQKTKLIKNKSNLSASEQLLMTSPKILETVIQLLRSPVLTSQESFWLVQAKIKDLKMAESGIAQDQKLESSCGEQLQRMPQIR